MRVNQKVDGPVLNLGDLQAQERVEKGVTPNEGLFPLLHAQVQNAINRSIRRDRQRLFQLETRVKIQETEAMLAKLSEKPRLAKPKKSIEIDNLDPVVLSILAELKKPGLLIDDDAFGAVSFATEFFRNSLIEEKNGFNGKIALLLKPGFQEEIKRITVGLAAGPIPLIFPVVATQLRAIGHLEVTVGDAPKK
jgi:hypothetical protein